jgi:hypothetical protein
MAHFVLRNASVKINSIDLSDHMSSVSVETTADDIDVTAMGAGGRQHLAGIRNDQFTFEAFSDFAAAEIDATLWPLMVTAGTVFLVEVWADGTTTSTTNPKYSGSCVMLEYNPISGSVGDASMTPLTLPVNGTITRATT